MNFIFISPQFPHTYWQFCRNLKENGVNVLGIADAPYESLGEELKESLTEYYRVENMECYEQMFNEDSAAYANNNTARKYDYR